MGMKRNWIYVGLVVAIAGGVVMTAEEKLGPPIRAVDPGGPGKAPSDAVVLFDGHNLSQWRGKDGSAAKWIVADSELHVNNGTGDIYSKPTFKDAQIHVEFATPYLPEMHGQARANSGVYIQSHYEMQILDSFDNPTYFGGSAGSVYMQHDPLVNVSRKPGEWQAYDIIFHTAQCDSGGQVTKQPQVTILLNGVLVQDDTTITSPTGHGDREHICDAGPLELQDHGHSDMKDKFMRFRNVWFRSL